MLITKNFIVINNPKTGSSFMRTVLKEIYTRRTQKYSWLKKRSIAWKLISPEFIELYMPTQTPDKVIANQHGAVSQIPKKHAKNKAVVSVVRNPYTKLLSQYEFKWWQKNYHLFVDKELVYNDFPHFPNLTFDEFVDFTILSDDYKYPKISKRKIGNQTTRFVEMFFDKPQETIANLNDDYILSGTYKKDLKPITFLQQENLKTELLAFLSRYDFTPQELETVSQHERVNVTRNKHPNRMKLHTEKSLEYIKIYERLLFKIYEDLGFFYELPSP